jgi:osmotically-inducible protein OsmY
MKTQIEPGTELAQRVRDCLLNKQAEFRLLDVWADRGTVKLSGPMNSFYLRQLAISLARRLPGVLHVVDDMHVVLNQVATRHCSEPRQEDGSILATR